MPKLITEASRNNLLGKMRRQRLRYIAILPSLITLLNGVCGFAAIVFAAKGVDYDIKHFTYHKLELSYFAMSGYMLMLAMVADMLDGRVARMSKNTSSFGGQLDSLCDMISFGAAPAFLMLKIFEYESSSFAEHSLAITNLIQRFIWLAAATYVSCAAIRLARFNVENEEDESAHMSFVGLPTPAAAGVIASLVIFHQETLAELTVRNNPIYLLAQDWIIYILPVLSICAAILMVSRIRYPHVVNQYVKGQKPFAHFVRILFLCGLIIWSIQSAMVLIFCGFAASGTLRWLYHKIAKKSSNLDPDYAIKNE